MIINMIKNKEEFDLIVKVIDDGYRNDKSLEVKSLRQAIHILDDFFEGRPLQLSERPDWELFKKFAMEHSVDEFPKMMMDIILWMGELPEELMPEASFYQDPNNLVKTKIGRILKRKKYGEFYYE